MDVTAWKILVIDRKILVMNKKYKQKMQWLLNKLNRTSRIYLNIIKNIYEKVSYDDIEIIKKVKIINCYLNK